MTRKGKTKLATWLAANAPGGLARRASASGRDDLHGARPKRKPLSASAQWSLQQRLYVPMPLPLKCEVMRIARENGMSQAELGLRIVQAVIGNPAWLATVLVAAESVRSLGEKEGRSGGERSEGANLGNIEALWFPGSPPESQVGPTPG